MRFIGHPCNHPYGDAATIGGRQFRRREVRYWAIGQGQLVTAPRLEEERDSQISTRRGNGILRSHVDRLFNLNHHSRLDQIEAAFRVLGKRFVVSVEDAA